MNGYTVSIFRHVIKETVFMTSCLLPWTTKPFPMRATHELHFGSKYFKRSHRWLGRQFFLKIKSSANVPFLLYNTSKLHEFLLLSDNDVSVSVTLKA